MDKQTIRRLYGVLIDATFAVWAVPMPEDVTDEREWRETQAAALRTLVWDEDASDKPSVRRLRRRVAIYIKHMKELASSQPQETARLSDNPPAYIAAVKAGMHVEATIAYEVTRASKGTPQ